MDALQQQNLLGKEDAEGVHITLAPFGLSTVKDGLAAVCGGLLPATVLAAPLSSLPKLLA
jgi:hypothetical protein